jgi:hypothetical protein
MFGSAILDVAIGLIFVFLVISLIITATSELIASWLKWRAKNLEEGIRNLLRDRTSKPDPSAKSDTSAKPDPSAKSDPSAVDIARELYNHPLVDVLSKPGGKPSYIPSRTFALTLLDVLGLNEKAPKTSEDLKTFIDSIPHEALKKSLRVLSEEAEHNLERLKVHIEIWFNNSMDRVSGWYKRKTQFVHVILGIVFAFALNVDTYLIARTLASDSALRASLVAQAQELAKEKPDGTDGKDPKQEIQERIKQLGGLGLPIGWVDSEVEGQRRWPGWVPGKIEIIENENGKPTGKTHWSTRDEWLVMWKNTLRFHIIGWLLTAFASSLGAPFWFDLLNKFMNLRSVGKAPEEKPKDPKKQPKPIGPGETAEKT